jgi:hypothetical protein
MDRNQEDNNSKTGRKALDLISFLFLVQINNVIQMRRFPSTNEELEFDELERKWRKAILIYFNKFLNSYSVVADIAKKLIG